IPNPDDDEFRTTTFVVSGVEKAPTIEVIRGLDDQYVKPSVEFDPAENTATVILESNGYVDFVICTEDEKEPEPSVDKAELKELIGKVESMDLSKYTEKSSAAVRNALEAAKTVMDSASATQKDVDDALALLQESIDKLEEAAVKPDAYEDDKDGNSGSNNGSDPDAGKNTGRETDANALNTGDNTDFSIWFILAVMSSMAVMTIRRKSST
ncbi:MAG TPA: FIVAR domain-containing protein, partial [Candidatus Mediterraneibacter caccavium]|nr:FIVAR domain-containing protein [Candidatus Mediterraneibacter caccavium]